MKILIVGLGAIGSHVALALRNVDAELHLCDFDTVEQKNTQAQLFDVRSVGKNKASQMSAMLYGMYRTRTPCHTVKLTRLNAKHVIDSVSLVLDCTDNIAAREDIMIECKEQGDIPLLHGAMSADGTFAQVTWTRHFKPDAEDGDGVTCEDGENLPFHLLVGSQMAIAAQQFIRDGTQQSYIITPNGVMLR